MAIRAHSACRPICSAISGRTPAALAARTVVSVAAGVVLALLRPAAGKVVADLVHELHTGIGQDRGQLMGGADRDEGVVRVGEQQHRLRYAGQRRGEAAGLVH